MLADLSTPPGRGIFLSDVVRELGALGVTHVGPDVAVLGVRHDSRTVLPGDLFVARNGEHTNGAAFVSDALSRGASAVAISPGETLRLPPGTAALVSEDLAGVLAFASAVVYGHPSFALEVVGVTGTNGKTTVTHLLRSAIDGALGHADCGVVGTVGSFFAGTALPATHTTPEADELARILADMRARGAHHVAMEVSSHALSLGRVRAVRFRVAGFTNLTQDHLDFHGTMENYAAAKEKLFTELGPACAVLNVDDPMGAALARKTRARVIRTSARGEADIAVRRVEHSLMGMVADIATPEGVFSFRGRLFGMHNLENVCLALGICHALDLSLERAVRALECEPGAPGRLERCDEEGDDVRVLVDYAHTPDALSRALLSLRPFATGRLVCLFGCGGDRDEKKRDPMGEAAARGADVLYLTSDNPRTEDPEKILGEVLSGVLRTGYRKAAVPELHEVAVEPLRERAIALAIADARAGDVILIAGKGHETYQIVGETKRPFDDRRVARDALRARRDRRRGGDA